MLALAPEKGSHWTPRILFIDAFDSFSNNIISLLSDTFGAEIKRVMIKDPSFPVQDRDFQKKWEEELARFDAVVLGPGPGRPETPDDVGLMKEVWKLNGVHRLPVLGICLGFQSLVYEHGGKIRHLKQALHGQVRRPDFRPASGTRGDIFQGTHGFGATLYHSLCADIGQDDIPAEDWPEKKFQPQPSHKDLIPLAWVEEPHADGTVERILMAVKHATLPYWGLQYHPESVCTDQTHHSTVLQNWLAEVVMWNQEHGRVRIETQVPSHGQGWAQARSHSDVRLEWENYTKANDLYPGNPWMTHGRLSQTSQVCTPSVMQQHLRADAQLEDVVEFFATNREEDVIVLDSSNCRVRLPTVAADVRGRYSIIALDVGMAPHFEHRAGTTKIRAYVPNDGSIDETFEFQNTHGGFWQWISHFTETRHVALRDSLQLPFRGGFMGVFSYEMGLHNISVDIRKRDRKSHPDVSLVWVTKSLVIDHKENIIYHQFLQPPADTPNGMWHRTVRMAAEDGAQYTRTMRQKLRQLDGFLQERAHSLAGVTVRPTPQHRDIDSGTRNIVDTDPNPNGAFQPRIELPNGMEYHDKVVACQAKIRDGESYELCLTDEAVVSRLRAREMAVTARMHGFGLDRLATTGPGVNGNGISGNGHMNGVNGMNGASGGNGANGTNGSQRPSGSSGHGSVPVEGGNMIHKTDMLRIPDPRNPEIYSPFDDSWDLYVRLRRKQPAPFGSYIRLGGLTVISSSPERFLDYTNTGICTMRPMKGTVKKSPRCSTLEQAQALLHVPKEEAENLMIVDLVRHDLHGVCGPTRVLVPKLMKVEEYASVFQMVSIVHGSLPPRSYAQETNTAAGHDGHDRGEYTGLDILSATFPPGSMTGAPKKRSCEILQSIEKRERGIYSGVIGYHCVTGRGDWSVNIRCMFRWDDECGCVDGKSSGGRYSCEGPTCRVGERWHVGAGGAVTILSSPVDETAEMSAKLEGTLKIFEGR